ncbi:MAG TPA: hypothetical protein VF746_30190 [Longimicrobium sp.]|jgi:hypothetical protein
MLEKERNLDEMPDLQRWIDRFRTPPPEYSRWSRLAAVPDQPGSAGEPGRSGTSPPDHTG